MTELQRWLEALQSSDVMTRLAAIRAVAAAQIGAAAEPLLRLLDDPSDEVRAAAVNALSRLRLSHDAVQRVREALALRQSDPSPLVRQAISAALIELEHLDLSEQAADEEADSDTPRSVRDAYLADKAQQQPKPVADAPYEEAPYEEAPAVDAPLSDVLPAIEIPVLPMSPFNPPPAPPAPASSTGIPLPPAPAPYAPAPQPIPRSTPTEQTEESMRERRALEQEAQEVQFSAYFPREIAPGRWYPLTAYLFKSFAAEQVLADAQSTLGAWLSTVRRVISNVRRTLPEGTIITATPHMEGIQFNPPAITLGFYEDWHRLNFRLRTNDAPLYQSVNGRLTFTVEGVIVAEIPLSVYITDETGGTASSSGDSGGSHSGDRMQTVSQKLYKSIFCSYSRDDKAIVERVERVYKALGFDFLRDVVSLKSGEDWNDKLYDLIEQADIFQLFWSKTAAESEFVEREWRHALSLDRDETNFIRPVYWAEPMPPVPTELGGIHFAYEPTLDDNL